MTREERWERGNRLCRELSLRVAEAASPGLGLWDPAWIRVEGPSTRFLDLLKEWEETGDAAVKERVKRAAGEVLEAWKDADRQYREAGAPRSRPAVPA